MDPKKDETNESITDFENDAEFQKKIKEIDSRLAAFQNIAQAPQDQEGNKLS
jgi:hypothetical protein